MSKHIFSNACVDFSTILAKPDLDHMLKTAHAQSKTELARMRVDFDNYKDYNADQWCPTYFGMFVEWLASHYLNHFGHLFNVEQVSMTDSVGSTTEDYGVDGIGSSFRDQIDRTTGRKSVKGSPVYVQVKGTLNKTKEYKPNDGSRLPNFGMNAMSAAIKSGHAYQSRYIVFTTGAGLHYALDKMSNNMLEVIGYKKIRALVNDNNTFLNILRESVNLPLIPNIMSQTDPDYSVIQREILEDSA